MSFGLLVFGNPSYAQDSIMETHRGFRSGSHPLKSFTDERALR